MVFGTRYTENVTSGVLCGLRLADRPNGQRLCGKALENCSWQLFLPALVRLALESCAEHTPDGLGQITPLLTDAHSCEEVVPSESSSVDVFKM